MATPVFPQRLYTKGEEPIPLKSIGYYSGDTKLFDALSDALKPDELQEIRDSSLGFCLKFHDLDFGWASRLVHHMLTFQLHCKKKFELWSLIGSNPVRFSLNEFEAITGLDCHYVENLENPDVEVTEEMREFWELLGVAIDVGPSIDNLTEACKICSDWTRDDRLRLGYLAIYAGYIEAKKASSPTRVSIARLVMDLDAFKNYPWGRVAFKNLVESVKEKDLCKSYYIDGFVQVLQIWVYFALPEYGAEFGEPIPNISNNPPLLCFKGSRGRKYVKENMLKQTCVQNMVVKEFEDMFPQWDDDEEDEKSDNIIKAMYKQFGDVNWKWNKKHWSPVGLKVSLQVKSESVGDQKRSCESEEGSRKRCRSEPSAVDGDVVSNFDSLKTHIDGLFHTLTTTMLAGFTSCEQKITLLADKVKSMEEKRDPNPPVKSAQKDEDKDSEQVNSNVNPAVDKDSEQVNSHVNPAVEESRPVVGTNPQVVSESVNGGYETSVELVDKAASKIDFDQVQIDRQKKAKNVAQNVVRAKSERERKLAWSQISPFKGNSTAKVIIPNQAKIGKGYDPFAAVEKQKTNGLIDWLKRDINYRKYLDMEKLPFWPPEKEDPSVWWWFTLLTPAKWLHETVYHSQILSSDFIGLLLVEHLDAGIKLFQRRYTKHPEWFRSDRLCFIDSVFTVLWTTKYEDFLKSPPNPDGSGKRLPPGAYELHTGEYCRSNRAWGYDVDEIYTFLNIKKSHWVALCISIPERHITVWDSDVKVSSREELGVHLDPLAVMIPYVLRELAPADKRGKFTYDKFTFHREEKGVPQNKVSGDCGVYCLKFIECQALGLPFPSTFCDAKIPNIRQKLASDIFNETEIRGNEKQTFNSLDVYDQ